MNAEPTWGANRPLDLSSLCLALTEHAPSPMAAVEGATHIVRYGNPAFCQLIGKPLEQLVGKRFETLLPEMGVAVTLIERVFHSGKTESHIQPAVKPHSLLWSYIIWPVREDEEIVGVMIQVTETAKHHGEAVAVNQALMLSSLHQHELTAAAEVLNEQLREEIVERKLAEEALNRAQGKLADHAGELEGLVAARTTELTATNKQLEAFVYSIAHDLRAPLRAMQGFSTLLVQEAGDALNDTAKDYAARIDRAAQFMDALLSDLLDFSRVSQQHVELAPVELGSVVELVLSRLQKEIHEKHGRVDSSGPWPAVLAHRPTLAQIMFNLISNALKFGPPDMPPHVQLHVEEQAIFIRVWVEDNGIGIAPEYCNQIFRLFTRLHGEKYQGTGVGLAIVQKGIESMGGRVGVESIPGQGSRFWFELRKV